MSGFFCVHSAVRVKEVNVVSFSVYTTMAPAMAPTINLGASNEPTVLYAVNGIVFLPTAAVLLRRKM